MRIRSPRPILVLASVVSTLTLGVAALAAPTTAAPNGHSDTDTSVDRDVTYEAIVRRTEGGVPNIRADDYASMGYGTGYAMAEDNVCMIADLVITFAAERSSRMAPTPANVASDSFYQLFIDRGEAAEALSEQQARVFRGAAAGFNRYLRDVGVDSITDPACRDKSWVRPITELDLRRISRMPFFLSALSGLFVAATPPAAPSPAPTQTGAGAAVTPDEAVATLFEEWRGSNGVALGKDATAGGTGMLLANPHLSWNVPAQRMYALHQTIPGEMNMVGATTMGRIQVAFGATDHVAWTATVSKASDYTFYRLDLVPGKPTSYYFNGEERPMVKETVTVDVPDGSGGHTSVEHTFYSTHYGARLVGGPGFPWTADHAYAVRSIDPAWRGVDSLNATWKATSVAEFAAALHQYQAQTTNIMVVDSSGRAYYSDADPIPYLSAAQQAACAVPGGLDGSRSDCMWQTHPDATTPGTFGPDQVPQLFRNDFVANMNDSYWLTNPSQPLTGFPSSFGSTGTERTLRTRSGLDSILSRLGGTDGQAGRKFTLRSLQDMMLANTSYAGKILRDDMVTLCRANPNVTLADSAAVDITEACDALENWDLAENLDSRGAHLFREIMIAAGNTSTLPAAWNYAVPFDATDPVNTPRGLDVDDNSAVLQAIGKAVQKLRDAGISLDARLGDVQSVTRNGQRIPMHGGTNASGLFNIINAPFDAAAGGYPDVTAGSSWIQATEYRADGVRSRGILTFSQSANPNSPHYADMTRFFSQKRWVDLPMTATDVAASAVSTIALTEDATVCDDGGWATGLAVAFTDEQSCRDYYEEQRTERLVEYDTRHSSQALVYQGGALRLQGTVRVGTKLRVVPVRVDQFVPVANSITYQWLRDGMPIQGATDRTYLVKRSDAGSTVQLRVTATAAKGDVSQVVSNQATIKRAKATIVMKLAKRSAHRLWLSAKVRAAVPVKATLRVTVLRNNAQTARQWAKPNRNGVVELRIPVRGPGRYVVRVEYLGSPSVLPATAKKVRRR